MGSVKRKTGDRDGRASSPFDKTKPSIADPDQADLGVDSDEDPAQVDPPVQVVEDLGVIGDESGEGQGRSAYLVACHWDWSDNSEPYAVYKVGVATSCPSRVKVKRKRLHRVTRLPTVAGGKTFTSLRSLRNALIIGVGGNPSGTVIFDTKTNKVIQGPILNSAKWCPVLTTVGDKVYAMAKTPSWIKDPNFPPWFEVLDLSNAKVVTTDGCSRLERCSWIELPHPPCFPWKLSPLGYTMLLPVVLVMSYVVVDTYILVSFNQPWGTYAFDTNSVKWHKVNDKRLPFIGRATPHGSLFLGLSKDNGPVNAYLIHVTTSDKDHAPNLSITVLPVNYMEHEVDGPCFFSLEDGRFCSFSFSLDSCSITLHPEKHGLFPKEAHVNLTTYQTENPSSLEVPEEALLPVKPVVAVCSQWKQVFKISCSSHGFSPFAFTLLSI